MDRQQVAAEAGPMDLRSLRAQMVVLASLAVTVAACGGQVAPAGQAGQPATSRPKIAYANIGGYLLAYECAGTGRPTVILEAGYTSSGIDTYGRTIPRPWRGAPGVCTYDRAGDGLSNARPASVRPLTGATQARELHTLLQVIHVGPPYVLAGHSYGGMIVREFAALYPVGLEYTTRADLRPWVTDLGLSGGDAEDFFSAGPVLGEIDLRRSALSVGGWQLARGVVGPGGVVVPKVLRSVPGAGGAR
jgi:pimeloyl-ACP methyl ester carboxylesterase